MKWRERRCVREAELLQCGISDWLVAHPRSARRLSLSSVKPLNRSIFGQLFAPAAEPEPLIINH
jgi:hypothetical protein